MGKLVDCIYCSGLLHASTLREVGMLGGAEEEAEEEE